MIIFVDNIHIALVHFNFGSYHITRARALISIHLGEVKFVQLSSKEAQREWNSTQLRELYTVADGTLETLESQKLANQLVNLLAQLNPSAIVIAGYEHQAMRVAASWAKKYNISTVLLSDSQQKDRVRNPCKELIKGWWIRKYFDAAFVAGSSAASYLENLGFPPERIWRGYDVVDNKHFARGSTLIRKTEIEWRTKLNLPKRYFLYVGRFSEEKNLLGLLRAYQLYKHRLGKHAWSLVLVGSGSQEKQLKTEALQLGLTQIVWAGFQQVEQLPTYYSLASALILPSVSESWGLVVNEAMACGLPVLVSKQCGCVPDLVFPGINGYIFDPFNIENLTSCLEIITHKASKELTEMGHASKNIIKMYTPELWAKALVDCVNLISKKHD